MKVVSQPVEKKGKRKEKQEKKDCAEKKHEKTMAHHLRGDETHSGPLRAAVLQAVLETHAKQQPLKQPETHTSIVCRLITAQSARSLRGNTKRMSQVLALHSSHWHQQI